MMSAPSAQRPAGLFLVALLATSADVNAARLAGGGDDFPAHVESLLVESDPATQFAGGQAYEHGSGVARDYASAVKLYCTAARDGEPQAAYALGWMYAVGRGVARDDALAVPLFASAARQGDAHAARMLERLGAGEASADAAEPHVTSAFECRLPDGSRFLPPVRSVPNPSRQLVKDWVRRLAPAYDLPAELVIAVIAAESGFNSRAVSPVGAQGLMQLMPGTAARFGVDDVFDPVQNLHGGMAYLRWLDDHFEGDTTLVLAGYNAGEHAVRRYKGVPPYRETRGYVKKVTAIARRAGLVLR